jgi:Caudovirus prohead serine protease
MSTALSVMTSTRVVDLAPSSYDQRSRTVDAVISMGSPVQRFYGTEVLRIHPDAVDTSRVLSGACPVLDSHQQSSITHALGRVIATWFRGNAFMGRLAFNDTDRGREAEGMIVRNEIAAVSAGYRVTEWEVRDNSGRVLDQACLSWDDDDLTFEAVRWQLLECSLVTIPADASAAIRSDIGGLDRALTEADLSEDVRVRMAARMRIATRQRMFERQQAFGLT